MQKNKELEKYEALQEFAKNYKDQLGKLPKQNKIDNYSHFGDRPCPNCGHCPTCGRGGWSRPWYPYQPYWLGDNPDGPTWTATSGNITTTLKTGYMVSQDGPSEQW